MEQIQGVLDFLNVLTFSVPQLWHNVKIYLDVILTKKNPLHVYYIKNIRSSLECTI